MNIRKNRSIFCLLFVLFTVGLGFFLHKFPTQITDSSFPVKNMAIIFLIFFPFLIWSLYEIVRILKLNSLHFFLVFLLILFSFLSIPGSLFVLKYGVKWSDLKKLKIVWILCSGILGSIPFIISNKCIHVNELLRDNIRFVSFLRLCIGFLAFWGSLFFIIFFCEWKLVILLFSLSFVSDTIAYLCGKLGKDHVFSSSPTKTLEGFLASSIITPIILFIVWAFGLNQSVGLNLVFSFLFMPLFANIGDLYFSKQKRLVDIKDFGGIFGGHGGFWDRFDSHCFALSLFALAMTMW